MKELSRVNRNENQMIIKALNMYGRVPETWELLEEIERLNNIINEFDKLIENEINESKLEDNYERVDSLEYCLATLRELKGNDK